MQTIDLPLEGLKPHPRNAREKGETSKKAVAELASSIASLGLLQPLVVMADGKHEGHVVLAGHRRLAALKSLGKTVATCRVIPHDEGDSALAVLLADNATHESVNPLMEAEAIEQLLDENGDSENPLEIAASVLGRGMGWVLARRRLANLSPAWVKVIKSGKPAEVAEIPLGHLEDLAALTHEAQDAFLKELGLEKADGYHGLYDGIPVRAAWRGDLQRSTRALKAAPWSLDDEQLVKSAGACTACPKRSSQEGNLFDDGKASNDRCLDGNCFAAKMDATVELAVKAAVEQHGNELVFASQVVGAAEKFPLPEGAMVRRSWDLTKSTKKAGGKPVLDLDSLKVSYMKVGSKSASSSTASGNTRPRGPDGKPKPKTLKQRREDHEKRRRVMFLHMARAVIQSHARAVVGEKIVDKETKRKADVTVPVPVGKVPSLRYVCDQLVERQSGHRRASNGPQDLAAPKEDRGSIEEKAHRALWDRACGPLAEAIKPFSGESASSTKDKVTTANVALLHMDVDADAMYATCVEALPEPKSWANLKADGTPKAKPKSATAKPRKKKASAKKKAAAKASAK